MTMAAAILLRWQLQEQALDDPMRAGGGRKRHINQLIVRVSNGRDYGENAWPASEVALCPLLP